MEALSKRSPSTPSTSPPRRHIHSSFPHYFYSTPTTPSSDSLSAFVALCESRLAEASAPPPDSSDSTVPHVQAAPATTSPLKPPPRLQYIANIRKSLRMRRLRGSKDDPFAVAVEKVTREDASGPWRRLPWRWSRRSNVCETDVGRDDDHAKAKRRGVAECVKSAISTMDERRRRNRVLLSREESAWLIRKPSGSNNGKLVGLACFGFLSRDRVKKELNV